MTSKITEKGDLSEFLKGMLTLALVYNTSKEKMEVELRNFLTIRIIDGTKFNIKVERQLIRQLNLVYGVKYNYRSDQLLDDYEKKEDPKSDVLSVITLSQLVWPAKLFNSLSSRSIPK
jgi:hypothetical protein